MKNSEQDMKNQKQKKQFRAVTCQWKDGVWSKAETYFDTFGHAKHFCKKADCRCKVYGIFGILEYDNNYDSQHTSPYC